ncbi:hypothetical protein GCM10009555_022070 [Acrocarpospora macrocephala]|uniref:Uncharacterized protein n=1 Tax=Acrocarpospora macrocephala TaxID=150177 RepID=A0A5M3WW23_9ACTN|nr:hypothetical protein Amac_057360 [Acrocarpospora macrocephala]
MTGLLRHLPMDKLRQLTLLVRPDTILRWHRDLLRRGLRPRGLGRPRTVRSIRALVLRLAREVPGSDGFTWIRKVKGTIACQESSGRVQAYEARRWGTRVIWRKLDCLNLNLQTMQQDIRRKDV